MPRQALEPADEADVAETSVDPASGDFVSRVSTLPIFGSALKVYEVSKKRSKVVKVSNQVVFAPGNLCLMFLSTEQA